MPVNLKRFSLLPNSVTVSLILCLGIGTTPTSKADSNIFSGYVKSYALYQDAIKVDGAVENNTLIDSGFQSQNSLRLMNSYLSAKGNVEIHYEIQPLYASNPIYSDDGTGVGSTISIASNRYRYDDLNPVFTEINDNTVVIQNLDRLNYQYNGELGDLTIGRQVVSFGSARFINPTDIFVPFSIQTLNQEYRVGIDAIRFQADLGDFAMFDSGLIIGKGAKAENSAAFLRGKNSIAGNDIEGMVIFLDDAWLAGGGIERAIGNFGFWFETAYMQWRDRRLSILENGTVDQNGLPLNINMQNESQSPNHFKTPSLSPKNYWRSSVGFDYSLSDNVIAMFEYHYNGAGTGKPEQYSELRNFKSYQKAGVFLLGKHYLIPAVSWIASPLVSVSASAFINVQDRSTFFTIKGERSWSDNLYSDFGLYLSTGDNFYTNEMQTELNYGSEFGGYPTSIYASLRYYF